MFTVFDCCKNVLSPCDKCKEYENSFMLMKLNTLKSNNKFVIINRKKVDLNNKTIHLLDRVFNYNNIVKEINRLNYKEICIFHKFCILGNIYSDKLKIFEFN